MTTPEKKLKNTLENKAAERHTERGTTPAVATSPFARSVASLKDAISYGEGRVPETVLLDAAETLERLSQRRELSTEHTVIGFFGATGSGKSTLFNAIAGQNIALSAPTRPTTSTVQAAIWEAEGSEELLDWLGIDKRVYPQTQALAAEGDATESNEADGNNKAGGNNKASGSAAAPNAVTEPAPGLFNRIRRAIGGRGEMLTRTGGLILLDMPDFDSVTTTNRDLAARMMRYVDVLVWVVDPQNTPTPSSTATSWCRLPHPVRRRSACSTRRTNSHPPRCPPCSHPSPACSRLRVPKRTCLPHPSPSPREPVRASMCSATCSPR